LRDNRLIEDLNAALRGLHSRKIVRAVLIGTVCGTGFALLGVRYDRAARASSRHPRIPIPLVVRRFWRGRHAVAALTTLQGWRYGWRSSWRHSGDTAT